MIVVRNIARGFMLAGPALALAACGADRQAELERQLAEAAARAQAETAAREAAERNAAAARAKARDAALAEFYGGSSDAMEDESPVEDEPEVGPEDRDDIADPDPAEPAAGLRATGA